MERHLLDSNHDAFRGIRVSPSVDTIHEEIDRFADAMDRVIRTGLPRTEDPTA